VAHDGLLRLRAVALRRRRGAVALSGRGGLLEDEGDRQLGVAAVGQVVQELLGQHVHRARHLGLRRRRGGRLREHGLVGAGAGEQRHHHHDDHLLVHESPPCDELAPCSRVRTISTRRFCPRPAGVALLATGCSAAKPPRDSRLADTPARASRCTTAPARAPDSCQLDGYCEVAMGRSSVWPSTRTGWLRSVATIRPILSSVGRAAALIAPLPESKNSLSVSSLTFRPCTDTV